jgi:hypothetical protein
MKTKHFGKCINRNAIVPPTLIATIPNASYLKEQSEKKRKKKKKECKPTQTKKKRKE